VVPTSSSLSWLGHRSWQKTLSIFLMITRSSEMLLSLDILLDERKDLSQLCVINQKIVKLTQ